MKIELRNIQYSAFASEETHCFTATVLIDGVKVGTADNHGHGGPTTVSPREVEERINTYAKTLPPITAYGMTLELDAEIIIGELVNDWLVERDVKRAMGRKVLFTKADKPGIFETKAIPADRKAAFLARPDLLTVLKADKVLNLIPIAEAVALYRAAAKS